MLPVPSIDGVMCDVDPPNTEGRLRKELLCKYSSDLVPRLDRSKPLIISIMLALKSFNFVSVLCVGLTHAVSYCYIGIRF